MKLHLGCGKKYIGNEWIHIDIQKFNHIDYQIDIRNLDIFKNESIDEIYICHVLEHFPRNELENILSEWYRVLKVGGMLRIAVPDFESVCNLYKSGMDIEKFYGLVSGGQKNEYDFHYHIFDEKSLSSMMYKIGFSKVVRYDWKDFLPSDYDDYSKAYIPHLDFQTGTLVSLNLIAIK